MKEYEIWIGYVPPQMGSEGVFDHEPKMVGKETAISFKAACFKYELKSTLASVEAQEKSGRIDSQSLEWWYNPHTNSNSWTGKYFETCHEAIASFREVMGDKEWEKHFYTPIPPNALLSKKFPKRRG